MGVSLLANEFKEFIFHSNLTPGMCCNKSLNWLFYLGTECYLLAGCLRFYLKKCIKPDWSPSLDEFHCNFCEVRINTGIVDMKHASVQFYVKVCVGTWNLQKSIRRIWETVNKLIYRNISFPIQSPISWAATNIVGFFLYLFIVARGTPFLSASTWENYERSHGMGLII